MEVLVGLGCYVGLAVVGDEVRELEGFGLGAAWAEDNCPVLFSLHADFHVKIYLK